MISRTTDVFFFGKVFPSVIDSEGYLTGGHLWGLLASSSSSTSSSIIINNNGSSIVVVLVLVVVMR